MVIFSKCIRSMVAFILFGVWLVFPATTMALPNGISGFSGASGRTCTICHSLGAAVPVVTLTADAGTTTVEPGTVNSFTLTMTGGPAADAGFDVAASAGTIIDTNASGTRILNGELIHSSPHPVSGGTITWTLNWQAPTSIGTYTLYAAALSANGSGPSWDGTGVATLVLTVAAQNQLPVAMISGPTNGTEGVAVTFDGSGSSDPDGTIVSYDWNFGDSSAGSGTIVTHTFVTGSYEITLTVTDDNGDTDQMSLSIDIAAMHQPDIQVVPSGYDFGDVKVAETSSALEITISNTGTDDLGITDIVLSDATNYSLNVDGGATPCASTSLTVPIDSHCTVNVSFTPTSVGVFNETLAIHSNVSSSPIVSVSLTGTGGSDGDGIPDPEEQGPDGTDNTYDGNNDGFADSQQDNVSSMHTEDGQHYVTLSTPDNTNLADVSVGGNPSPGDAPTDINFPFGFFTFTINNVVDSTTLTLTLPASETVDSYYKYGPTPGNLVPHWYEFLFNGLTGAQISGNTIILYFVDGQRGDDDLTVNGIIIDEGAPAIYAAQSDGGDGGNCFIATAAYGSYLDPHVVVLRTYRDNYLLTNPMGRKLVAAYYRFSPPVANIIHQREELRTVTRWVLTPFVYGMVYPRMTGTLLTCIFLMLMLYRRGYRSI